MKIMSRFCGKPAALPPMPARIIEITARNYCAQSLQLFLLPKETMMTWETPQATTFRFGFEITMYIANR